MKEGWREQTLWLADSLRKRGYEVLRHKHFRCRGLQSRVYNPKKDRNDIDLAIYNHTDKTKLIGNIVPAKKVLFMKPTVPTARHTTLDPLGYGPYSSITYDKPDFEGNNTDKFFDTKVKNWIESKSSKWATFKTKDIDIKQDDYYLVIGQCGGDSVVTEYDFGNYWNKLESVIRELVRVGNRPIVVKLHPYTDGKDATDTKFSTALARKLDQIDDKVFVYTGRGNIHNFLEKARCVFLANSGAGFEAMMHDKPIISWGYPEYHWVTYDLRHLTEIQDALKLTWFDKEKQRNFLYWYCEKYCYYNQATCDSRVGELLEKSKFDILWEKHKPSQGYNEYKMFLDFLKTKLPKKPVVVEIGLRKANQRYFYKELFNADYKGIDIRKYKGDDFIHGDSKKEETLNKLKNWLNGRKIDLLFIDGDHSYEGVKTDYELYSPLAKIVALHDIHTNHKLHLGVLKFWKELNKKRMLEFRYIEDVGYYGDGIGVIIKE